MMIAESSSHRRRAARHEVEGRQVAERHQKLAPRDDVRHRFGLQRMNDEDQRRDLWPVGERLRRSVRWKVDPWRDG
jgi:hypothetical protein